MIEETIVATVSTGEKSIRPPCAERCSSAIGSRSKCLSPCGHRYSVACAGREELARRKKGNESADVILISMWIRNSSTTVMSCSRRNDRGAHLRPASMIATSRGAMTTALFPCPTSSIGSKRHTCACAHLERQFCSQFLVRLSAEVPRSH